MLLRLRCQAPDLETQIVPGVSFNLLNQVEAGNIDLAVVIKPDFVLTKDLYSEPLLREPFVLVAPPDMAGDDPLALLRDAPFIRYDRTSFGGRRVSQFLRQQRLTPKIALEIDEIDAIVRMVEHNLAVALAGQWRERADHVRIVPLGESLTFYRELIVVMRYS
ncbi:LysR substrate-binding domain-containing protein [Sodalis glossinidius]|uniref:LysR substrate-binding domain-containing protein n=1 Tax=Sodalis glossinidius TaxID=63612 RepID=UPI0003258B0F|nr:LysR substrate-binding domain-containing protein [Sodalis glossinidius]